MAGTGSRGSGVLGVQAGGVRVLGQTGPGGSGVDELQGLAVGSRGALAPCSGTAGPLDRSGGRGPLTTGAEGLGRVGPH